MIKAFLLIFEPAKTWDEVARSRRSTGVIFLTFLLPMIIIAGVVEGYGLVKWGKTRVNGNFVTEHEFPLAEAVVYEVAQGLLYAVAVFAAAMMLKALGETFHGRHTFRQSFVTIAYGLSPLFLLRLGDAFHGVSPWATWTAGVMLSVAILYQGLPRVMLPDPPHAFGLYLMNSLLLILITGLVRFVTYGYLSGRFEPVERLISALAALLPF
jgi:hypothetical protein